MFIILLYHVKWLDFWQSFVSYTMCAVSGKDRMNLMTCMMWFPVEILDMKFCVVLQELLLVAWFTAGMDWKTSNFCIRLAKSSPKILLVNWSFCWITKQILNNTVHSIMIGDTTRFKDESQNLSAIQKNDHYVYVIVCMQYSCFLDYVCDMVV